MKRFYTWMDGRMRRGMTYYDRLSNGRIKIENKFIASYGKLSATYYKIHFWVYQKLIFALSCKLFYWQIKIRIVIGPFVFYSFVVSRFDTCIR